MTPTVRETSVSRHNGGLSESLPETPQFDIAVMIRGVSGGPQLGSHDAERQLYFQSG